MDKIEEDKEKITEEVLAKEKENSEIPIDRVRELIKEALRLFINNS